MHGERDAQQHTRLEAYSWRRAMNIIYALIREPMLSGFVLLFGLGIGLSVLNACSKAVMGIDWKSLP